MFPLDRLDDLSLLQVLSTLPLRELAAVRCTCQRAYRLGADDRLWQRHLQQQLGAAVQGRGLEAIYKLLTGRGAGHRQPRIVLPFDALLTDTGCDRPEEEYWAGNLFRCSTRSSLFCTAAAARNAHVLGVLSPAAARNQPPGAAGPSQPRATQQAGISQAQAQGMAAAAAAPAAGLAVSASAVTNSINSSEETYRALLLRYCAGPAAYLLRPITLAALRLGNLPYVPPACLDAARERLSTCSTKGLEDLFILAYSHMAQGSTWGRSLMKTINNDEDIHRVHSMAWSIWHHQAPRSRYTLQALDPLTRRQLVDTAAINRFMNRQKPTSNDQPWHLGVWEEVVIDRHTNVTSPVSCGVVYATTVHVTSTAASGSHTPATASSHTAAVKHTEQIDSVVGHRAATDILTGTEDGTASSGSSESQQWRNHTGPLYDTTNHPWVAVLSSVTSASEVLLLSAQGRLPPVYGHYCNHLGEWIEFTRQTQLTPADTKTDKNDDIRMSGDGAGFGTGGGRDGVCASVHPVVWFRYDTTEEVKRHRQHATLRARTQVQDTARAAVRQIIDQLRTNTQTATNRSDSEPSPQNPSPATPPHVSNRHGAASGHGLPSNGEISACTAHSPASTSAVLSSPPSTSSSLTSTPTSNNTTTPHSNRSSHCHSHSHSTPGGLESRHSSPGAAQGSDSGGTETTETVVRLQFAQNVQQWEGHNVPLSVLSPGADDRMVSPLCVLARGLANQVHTASNTHASTVSEALHGAAWDTQLRAQLLADPLVQSLLHAAPSAPRGGVSAAVAPFPTTSTTGPHDNNTNTHTTTNTHAPMRGRSVTEGGTIACDVPTQTLLSVCGMLHEVSEGAARDCDELGLWVSPHIQANSPHDAVCRAGGVGSGAVCVSGMGAGRGQGSAAAAAAALQLLGQGGGASGARAPAHTWAAAGDATTPAAARVCAAVPGWDWLSMSAAILARHAQQAQATGNAGGAANTGQAAGEVAARTGASTGGSVSTGSGTAINGAGTSSVGVSTSSGTQPTTGLIPHTGASTGGRVGIADSSNSAGPSSVGSGTVNSVGTSSGPASNGAGSGNSAGPNSHGASSGLIPPAVPVTRGMWEGPRPSYPYAQSLFTSAPEVSNVFGWGPGTNSNMSTLQMRLHQRWASNGILVKLTAPEDLRPSYNLERGGCNIDAAYCAVVGSVVELPGTCHLATHTTQV